MSELTRIYTTDWKKHAACKEGNGADVDLFTQNHAEQQRIIDSYCGVCPVRDACLRTALVRGNDYGIWGGTTPSERSVLKGIISFRTRLDQRVNEGREKQEKTPTLHGESWKISQASRRKAQTLYENWSATDGKRASIDRGLFPDYPYEGEGIPDYYGRLLTAISDGSRLTVPRVREAGYYFDVPPERVRTELKTAKIYNQVYPFFPSRLQK